MIPHNTWAPILQMLVFYDQGEKDGIERINLSSTDLLDIYQRSWTGINPDEQWKVLNQIIQNRDPHSIGFNISKTCWAGGGLTYNLYNQLVEAIPDKYKKTISICRACLCPMGRDNFRIGI